MAKFRPGQCVMVDHGKDRGAYGLGSGTTGPWIYVTAPASFRGMGLVLLSDGDEEFAMRKESLRACTGAERKRAPTKQKFMKW